MQRQTVLLFQNGFSYPNPAQDLLGVSAELVYLVGSSQFLATRLDQILEEVPTSSAQRFGR